MVVMLSIIQKIPPMDTPPRLTEEEIIQPAEIAVQLDRIVSADQGPIEVEYVR